VPRQWLRELKKALRAGTPQVESQDQQEEAVRAALALLERSIRMLHRRLAIQRLNEAVELGAQISDQQWVYCRQAAEASRDAAIQTLFTRSAQSARTNRN
jgi:hypothetical protein